MPEPITVDIYARSATEKQSGDNTLDIQETACRQYCDENGLTVGTCFREVISGISNPNHPPLLNKLRGRIRSGAIQGVVILRLNRLSRKLEYQLMLIEEIKQAGIALHIVSDKDNPMPELKQLQRLISGQEVWTLIKGGRSHRG